MEAIGSRTRSAVRYARFICGPGALHPPLPVIHKLSRPFSCAYTHPSTPKCAYTHPQQGNRSAFSSALADAVSQYNLDGVDIDWVRILALSRFQFTHYAFRNTPTQRAQATRKFNFPHKSDIYRPSLPADTMPPTPQTSSRSSKTSVRRSVCMTCPAIIGLLPDHI